MGGIRYPSNVLLGPSTAGGVLWHWVPIASRLPMCPVLITPTPTCRYRDATGSVGETVLVEKLVENSRELEVGSFSIGGIVAWMTDRDSKKNQSESPMERLSRVLETTTAVTNADPDEVEARLRNMSHGTNGD